MIRVFRACSNGVVRAEPSGPSLIAGSDRRLLLSQLQELVGRGQVTEREARTVEKALEAIEVDASADVIVGCEGSVFRVCRPVPPSTPSTPCDQRVAWLASDRTSTIVVADVSESSVYLMRDALRFVGYNTEALVVTPADGESLLVGLRSRRPSALLLGEEIVRACGTRIIEAVDRGEPMALIGLFRRGACASTSVPQELDGALELPLRLETVASVLEPALERVRAARSTQLKSPADAG